MPSTRHVSRENPSPKVRKQQNQFTFPSNSHLLVTTGNHIYAWDSAGAHTIFNSSKSSIVAAREAKDGSGILAVAGKHVVVLHDTKRGQERSWGLGADEDEVRHLEYTVDAKSLFLSTHLTADIQRYSTERSQLLAPSRAHGSPPVALAVSPTGHLLVSASDNPPVVYLKDLKQNSAPTLIEPQASETAVSKIAFHPERANIFLLAFRDGTIAAFDGTKISRNRTGSFANQESMNAGEISRLPQLHRTTSESLDVPSVSDAAFLPGYKTRAITTGSDGRCRLIDFADGGVILRTWHAKAPVTSISILSQKADSELRKGSASVRSSHIMGGPTSTSSVVAISRADGKVHLYDCVGLFLDQRAFSENGERILSVEWARGMSPKPISNSVISKDTIDLPGILPQRGTRIGKNEAALKPSQPTLNAQARRETTFEHIGLPPALRKPVDPGQAKPIASRKFTTHPDEVGEGTVRHNPTSRQANPVSAGETGYLDLFSPAKPIGEVTHTSPVKRLASPPRTRPRVSPQTFIKNPEPAPASQYAIIAKSRNLALFPSTDSNSETPRPSADLSANTIHHRATITNPPAQDKRITYKAASSRQPRMSDAYRITKPSPNSNAKILADLRKLNAAPHAHRASGTLAGFASSKPLSVHKNHSAKENALRLFRRPVDHVETDQGSEEGLKAYEHVHQKVNWPEDSNQDSSLDGDIWLTSDSDDPNTRPSRRQRRPVNRPPARQTSRSRVTSKGTMSTLPQKTALHPLEVKVNRATVDGSTDDDMLTAHTHISPGGAFSPSSNDVRDLFPRSSSLSPKKGRRSRKQGHDAHERPHQPLRDIALNSVAVRQNKSPWARVKAGEINGGCFGTTTAQTKHRDIRVFEDQGQNIITNNPQHAHCSICLPTKSRVYELEEEVAHLKGEVLALKAVLRRNGIAVPMSMG